jgi:hypothetical protein
MKVSDATKVMACNSTTSNTARMNDVQPGIASVEKRRMPRTIPMPESASKASVDDATISRVKTTSLYTEIALRPWTTRAVKLMRDVLTRRCPRGAGTVTIGWRDRTAAAA